MVQFLNFNHKHWNSHSLKKLKLCEFVYCLNHLHAWFRFNIILTCLKIYIHNEKIMFKRKSYHKTADFRWYTKRQFIWISIISFHMERISSMQTKNLNTWKWSVFLQKSTIRQSANWTFFCWESYGERECILNLQIINFFNIIILNRNKTYINIKVQASLLIFLR